MNTLLVPRYEDLMWGVLRVYADSQYKPMTAINFRSETNIMLNQIEAIYTNQTHKIMPDDIENFIQYFTANPLERNIHKLLLKAVRVIFERRKTRSIR